MLRPALWLILVTLLVGCFLLVVGWGSVAIPLPDILQVLAGGEASKPAWTNIILKFRLPKAITATLAGAALAVSGLQMQTLFRNPLADPFVLGISSGASLGVALVVLSAGALGATNNLSLTLAASLGAGGVLILVLIAAQWVENTVSLLIVGLMFGYMTSGLVSLLLYFSIPEQIQAYISWTFGSFGSVTWGQLQIFIPVISLGLLLALGLSKSLNALLLGETYARSLGVNIFWARGLLVCSTALLSGTVTAFCGPIGFIGLAVPHLSRALFRSSDHRILTPATLLTGGIIALLAALIAELPTSRLVLPLNAITALFGAPLVIWIILKQKPR